MPPSKMVADLAASKEVVKTDETPATPPATANSTAQTPVAPAEKQATFTAPAEPAKKSTVTQDDRYAIPAAQE